MGGPRSGRARLLFCKCGAERDQTIKNAASCRSCLRGYNRRWRRVSRGWPEDRWDEPSRRRVPEERGTCLACGRPFGDEGRSKSETSYHHRCFLAKRRFEERSMRGWPQERLDEPVWSKQPAYFRCRTCGGPRFDGGSVYWTTVQCRSCWRQSVSAYQRGWRVMTGRTLQSRRRTDGVIHA